MDALRSFHTTATRHNAAAMVVEVVMGETGGIALHGGIAGGADVILIPEITFDFDQMAEHSRA